MPLPSPPDSGAVPIPPDVLADLGADTVSPKDTAQLGQRKRTRLSWQWPVAVVVMILGIGAGGFMIYDGFIRPAAGPRADAPAQGTGREVARSKPANEAIPDDGQDDGQDGQGNPGGAAGTAAVAPAGEADDAGTGAAPGATNETGDRADEGEDDAEEATPQPMDKLAIRSKPRGARVYLDGSRQGKTPLTLDATADSHRLALILPGHKLHTADIDGSGVIDIELEEVTPPGGPAGIKVRCRRKNRYYVIVDGHDIGQLCPTERIGVDLGEHTVEIYDPVNDSRQEFHVRVEDTHHSLRVRVD